MEPAHAHTSECGEERKLCCGENRDKPPSDKELGLLRTLARKLKYVLWTLNGYVGRTVSAHAPQKVTVLITYYHPARMQHIEPQVRNILKCTFVEQLVISNHNPDVRIEGKILRSKIAAWSLSIKASGVAVAIAGLLQMSLIRSI